MLAQKKTLVTNNLRAFGIHGAMLALCATGVLLLGFLGLLIASFLSLFGYIFLAYKLLVPISGKNLSSVSWVAMLLILIFGGILMWSIFFPVDKLGFLALMNMPAFEAVGAVFRIMGISGITRSLWPFEAFFAAIVPSWLMYAGLCLRASTVKSK